jgi:cell division transport system permease protein
VLEQTPGVESARAITDEEQRALLEPWFGPDLPVEDLPVPRLIEIVETRPRATMQPGLRQRLAAEAPGAVLDDHTRWREPLAEAAGRLRLLGWVSLVLIAGAMAALITLAAQAALSANAPVIRCCGWWARATPISPAPSCAASRCARLTGAAGGTALGMAGVALLPGLTRTPRPS